MPKRKTLSSPHITKNKAGREYYKSDNTDYRLAEKRTRKTERDSVTQDRRTQEAWTNGVKYTLKHQDRGKPLYNDAKKLQRGEKIYTRQKQYVVKNVKAKPTATRKKVTKK